MQARIVWLFEPGTDMEPEMVVLFVLIFIYPLVYSPTKRAEGKHLDVSNPERVSGKQGEIPPPLGAEKEATPPFSRACPGVLIPFIF
jgi:hypothetical protein